MAEVRVALGEKSYNITIQAGSLVTAGAVLRSSFGPQLTNKTLVVSDDNVGPLYGKKLLDSLAAAGFQAEMLCVKHGEGAKDLKVTETLYAKAITMGLDRRSPVIALGGGVVGDLTGFVAATYMRGVPFIQMPTSLLAQVDSSVGGKTAVNHALGKNLIGVFYQPRLVLIDPETLQTLPERELLTGLAELIKHGCIADRQLFAYLRVKREQVLARQADLLAEIVAHSCKIKADVVAEDEQENGLRMILNFGHTIGHAVEGVTGYSKYTHGEAVAIGMHGAALLSYQLGHCDSQTVAEVREILQEYGLPVHAPGLQTENLLHFLQRDKKSVGGKIKWVLLAAIGKTIIDNQVPAENIIKVLQEIT